MPHRHYTDQDWFLDFKYITIIKPHNKLPDYFYLVFWEDTMIIIGIDGTGIYNLNLRLATIEAYKYCIHCMQIPDPVLHWCKQVNSP